MLIIDIFQINKQKNEHCIPIPITIITCHNKRKYNLAQCASTFLFPRLIYNIQVFAWYCSCTIQLINLRSKNHLNDANQGHQLIKITINLHPQHPTFYQQHKKNLKQLHYNQTSKLFPRPNNKSTESKPNNGTTAWGTKNQKPNSGRTTPHRSIQCPDSQKIKITASIPWDRESKSTKALKTTKNRRKFKK